MLIFMILLKLLPYQCHYFLLLFLQNICGYCFSSFWFFLVMITIICFGDKFSLRTKIKSAALENSVSANESSYLHPTSPILMLPFLVFHQKSRPDLGWDLLFYSSFSDETVGWALFLFGRWNYLIEHRPKWLTGLRLFICSRMNYWIY